MNLEVADILAINNLINSYGHIVDERQWSRMEELFTPDAVFDMTSFGPEVIHGLEALRTCFREVDGHPLAHHATNILIDADGDEVRVLSKGVSLRHGEMGSTVYRDVLRKTPEGWRIAHRIATKRRYETIPEPS
jgi:ketosteroid isomerase-like protein